MKWILPLVFIGVLAAAESYAGVFVSIRCRPPAQPAFGGTYGVVAPLPPQVQIQVVPVQIVPVQVVPVVVPVAPVVKIPVVTYRWGFFRRRIIPRMEYIELRSVQAAVMPIPAKAE